MLVEIGHERVQRSDRMSTHLSFMLLVEGQLRESRPLFKRGRTAYLEDFVELIGVVLPGEQRRPVDNLGEDAPN